MPHRKRPLYIWGYAPESCILLPLPLGEGWGRGSASSLQASPPLAPPKGRGGSPDNYQLAPEGHSRFRTSGGTAVNEFNSLHRIVSESDEETHPLPRGGTDLITNTLESRRARQTSLLSKRTQRIRYNFTS
jgi:hypothetical protein